MKSEQWKPELCPNRFASIADTVLSNYEFSQILKSNKVTPEIAMYLGMRLDAVPQTFIPLLEALIDAAKKAGMEKLAKVAQSNLDEENGMDPKTGETNVEKKHSSVRAYTRAAIESVLIDQPDLLTVFNNPPPIEEYTRAVHSLIDQKNPLELAGALALLELLISKEYSALLPVLQRLFPNLRLDQELKYFSNHAEHDEGHFNALLAAISESAQTEKDINAVITGQLKIALARQKIFYEIFLFRLSLLRTTTP